MNFFRTLQAVTDPRTETYTATNHTVQEMPAEHEVPAPNHQHLFAAMAFFAEHPGVPDADTPGLPIPVEP